MRLSTKGEYGLLAIIDLALNSNNGPVKTMEISERQGIPQQYLNQLLLILKKAGLISSFRGRQGGYRLNQNVRSISLLDVVIALEGPIENINFLGQNDSTANSTEHVLRNLWCQLLSDAEKLLKTTTLEEVCERRKELDKEIMYYI